MRILAVVLGLAVAGVRAFSPGECACEASVPDCADGCCGSPESESPSCCVHAEPSPDLAAPASGGILADPPAALVLPAGEPTAALLADPIVDATVPIRRPPRGRPLYLLDAALLI